MTITALQRAAVLTLIANLLTITIAQQAGGQCEIFEDQKLTPAGSSDNDRFGYAVAIDGDIMIVGAPGFSIGGAAFIFRFDGELWTEEAQLTASDIEGGDQFGRSVSISADTAIVGAGWEDEGGDNAGAAYVYRFDGSNWQETKLTASDAQPNDWFGYSVAVDNEAAVIGSVHNDETAPSAGAAYVFRFDGQNWVEEDKLLHPDGVQWADFGAAVSVSGAVAAVGDPRLQAGSAAVYRFDGSTWGLEQVISPSDGEPADHFGEAVAIRGDVLLVGSKYDDDHGIGSGSAYVYRFTGATWIEEAKLTSSDAENWSIFGSAVSLDDNVALIGAPGTFSPSDGPPGSAYFFQFNGGSWTEARKLIASDGDGHNSLGKSVSITGDVAALGAYADDDGGYLSGAAYVHSSNLDDTDTDGNGMPDECQDCNNNGVFDPDDIAEGTSPDCNANAVPDECDLADGQSQDCNGNGVPDSCDIADDPEADADQTGILDECEACGDLDGNGEVGPGDLAILLSAWGPQSNHPADFNDDGLIDAADLANFLAHWGLCD